MNAPVLSTSADVSEASAFKKTPLFTGDTMAYIPSSTTDACVNAGVAGFAVVIGVAVAAAYLGLVNITEYTFIFALFEYQSTMKNPPTGS